MTCILLILLCQKYSYSVVYKEKFIYKFQLKITKKREKMLTPEIIKRINDFVFIKPRTIDEIAKHIKKNWRTANRYVERIVEQQGTLAIRVFREGTRGALKIVYWTNVEQIHNSAFQEQLLEKIKAGKKREDFDPFDIYQHIPSKYKSAFLEEQEDESKTAFNKDLPRLLETTEKQLLIFSGNLSWANLTEICKILEELGKKNVSIKLLAKVNIDNIDNIKKFLDLNNKVGKDFIEIRHSEQPLRAFIIDKKLARFKEIKNPEEKKKKKMFIFYNIRDKEWIEWLQKIFWNLFTIAVPAERRIKEIESIKKLAS